MMIVSRVASPSAARRCCSQAVTVADTRRVRVHPKLAILRQLQCESPPGEDTLLFVSLLAKQCAFMKLGNVGIMSP